MTERKFTPPTTFPQEYADGRVVLGQAPDGGYIGHNRSSQALRWDADGLSAGNGSMLLTDLPKRVECFAPAYSNGLGQSFSKIGDLKSFLSGDMSIFKVSFDENGDNPTIEKVE